MSPKVYFLLMNLPLWYDEDIQDNRHVDQDIVEEDRQWHNTC